MCKSIPLRDIYDDIRQEIQTAFRPVSSVNRRKHLTTPVGDAQHRPLCLALNNVAAGGAARRTGTLASRDHPAMSLMSMTTCDTMRRYSCAQTIAAARW